VIANAIEIILISPSEAAKNISDSRAMLVEDLIAKLLNSFDVLLVTREADF